MRYPIARYLNVRQAYFPALSADGQRLAFLTNVTGLPQVWQVALPGAPPGPVWPDQLTFGHNRVQGVWASPEPGDGRLIFSRDEGGNENGQLFLLSADGSHETPLTPGHDDAMHVFGHWSAGGREILFTANRRHPALFDLYRQQIGGEAQLIFHHDRPGYLVGTTFSPNGRRVAFQRLTSSYQADLLELELQSGQVRQLNPAGPLARYAAAAYAADGRSLYCLTDLDADFLYVARLDLASLEMEAVVRMDWDCELLALSPDRRLLAYAVNEDGAFALRLLDLATGESRPCPQPDRAPGTLGQLDIQLVFSADSRRLAFSSTGATRTADVFIWELATGQAWDATRSSHGGLPRDSFVAPDLVRYPTFDGREIPAWLYRPPGPTAATGLPVVIIVHGGPESQMTPYFSFLTQYLVNNGYAVLAPNVRGSTGYGKAYSHLDDVEKRMDSVADLAHAAYWLRQQPGLDGRRLAVYGGSYGGFMVLSALTTYPDLWAAGVCLVGISNFVTFLENTSDYRRAHREAEYGSLARDRDFLARISPLNQVDNITAPLMVIHGANDPRVPLGEAEQIVAALRQREVPVDFLVFDDEGHGLVKLANKLLAYPAVVQFLDRHLQGE